MSAPKDDKTAIELVTRALQAAGWQLCYVDDGEEEIAVNDVDNVTDAVCAVDQAWLYVSRDIAAGPQAHVFFVLGNDPEEVICDYTVNLSDVIDPLTDSWF